MTDPDHYEDDEYDDFEDLDDAAAAASFLLIPENVAELRAPEPMPEPAQPTWSAWTSNGVPADLAPQQYAYAATGYQEPQQYAYAQPMYPPPAYPPSPFPPPPYPTQVYTPTGYDGPSMTRLFDEYAAGTELANLDAREISAWFGSRQVLDRVSLTMSAGQVTALIGPSGCGKSTFLRILNRMHELIPSAALAGEVLLDGVDIYDTSRRLTDARRQIGMVFQKPNPFPAMSIYDNVVAGLKLTGQRASRREKDQLVEECLLKAGLWREVSDRLRQPGGALSGGQQQRLCIARSLAIRPRVLLMDEPCSALDPTSTRVIEETIRELVSEVTIVIVTHNMQQAQRVSNQCAFFLAEQGTPGYIVEHGPTEAMFDNPQDPRTADYVNGRFG
jgi:phosphate transport system ATP-binding protein